MLAQKNINAIQRVKQLRKKYAAMVTSNVQKEEQQKKEFEKELGDIRAAEGTPNVIIKATDEANYRNLIDALDEMQICDIGKYVIVPITDFDKQMIEHLKNK
jgi:biopolymer transport protein ExbD